MKYLPIFLDLSGRSCLIVGAGEVAVRKVHRLKETGAHIVVVAPKICADLKALAKINKIEYIAEHFSEKLLDDKLLVIAATNDEALNRQIFTLATARGILVNVVDNPDLCHFIMPAVVERDPVQIAISSGGGSPVLARVLRAKIETLIPASYGRLARLLVKFRAAAKQRFHNSATRRRFWETVLSGQIAEMILAGQDESAHNALEASLSTQTPEVDIGGEVYLVGAGPGDPDLLTFRALRLMQQSEVVLYDRLVAPPIIDLCRRDAKRIYVGKQRDQHALPQAEINQLLVDLAKQGKRVLRLKGGDPFIFGRGGEEISTLTKENIPFQVIPGITAASGCASYAGIPLTHRDYAHTCIFVTGHLKDGKMALNWDALVQPKQTLVVYMGVAGLEVLRRELLAHGMSADMTVALVQQGTTLKQKVYTTRLDLLADLPKQHHIEPPTLIIVGEVVKLRTQLAWFDPQNS